MKKTSFILVFSFLCSFLFAQEGIPPKPSIDRPVNDLTEDHDFLSEDEITSLETKLKSLNDSTSVQVVIVVVEDLAGYEPADFAQRLGEAWGIGQKKINNGILILIKPKTATSKGQAFIASGYGMEGIMPDIVCTRIVEDEMIPKFKKKRYYAALDDATDVIIALAKKEYPPSEYMHSSDNSHSIKIALVIIFFISGFLGFAHWLLAGGSGSLIASIAWFLNNPFSLAGLFVCIILGFLAGIVSHGIILAKAGGGGFSSGGGGGGGSSFSFGGGSFGGGGGGGSW